MNQLNNQTTPTPTQNAENEIFNTINPTPPTLNDENGILNIMINQNIFNEEINKINYIIKGLEDIKGKENKQAYIINEVIDFIYNKLDYTTKKKLFLISKFLIIECEFKAPFKIIFNNLDDDIKFNLSSINGLYNYIKSKGKKNMKIDKDRFINNKDKTIKIKPSYNCCICLNDCRFDYKTICVNCKSDNFLCNKCFNNLTPHKCPMCRTPDIKQKRNIADDEKIINFIYNNRNYEIDEENIKNIINQDEDAFYIIYPDFLNDKKIKYFDLYINNLEELKENRIDNFINGSMLSYFNFDFLEDHIKIAPNIIKGDILKHIIKGCMSDSDDNALLILLGLVSSSEFNEEEIKENILNFLNDAITIDGLTHTLNFEFLYNLEFDDLYIYSEDRFYLSDKIKKYLKNNFDTNI